MPSSYSPNLRIELIASGEQANTWGYTTNTNLGTLIEQAICGQGILTLTTTAVTLTALNGASDQSRNMILNCIGSPGGTTTLTAPSVSKVYIVSNNTSDSSSVLIKTATGTSASIASGTTKTVWCDGVDFHEATNAFTQIILGSSPTISTMAATKGYVDGQIAIAESLAVPLAGGTMTGPLILSAAPSVTLGAATKGYVDTADAGKANTNGSNATGTWPIGISGNANTVTNGVYTSSSYADPAWITSLAGAKITGTVANATNAANPASGGSFITSSNIGSQSVNYASTAGSAPANGGTSAACSGNAATATSPQGGGSFITSLNIGSQSVSSAASCSGNAATASNPASGGSFITSSNIGNQSVNYAGVSGSCSGNAATSNLCFGNAQSAGYLINAGTSITYTTSGGGVVAAGYYCNNYFYTAGYVGIGSTSPYEPLYVAGGTAYALPASYGAPANAGWASRTGTITLSIGAQNAIAGAGIYSVSDRRLKENIEPLTSSKAEDFVKNAEPCTFDWIESKDVDAGYIAQDLVAQGFGFLVATSHHEGLEEYTDEHGNVSPENIRFSVRYDSVVPILHATIKDLLGRVEMLESELKALKG